MSEVGGWAEAVDFIDEDDVKRWTEDKLHGYATAQLGEAVFMGDWAYGAPVQGQLVWKDGTRFSKSSGADGLPL